MSDDFRVTCPFCGNASDTGMADAGKTLVCWACRRQFRVPTASSLNQPPDVPPVQVAVAPAVQSQPAAQRPPVAYPRPAPRAAPTYSTPSRRRRTGRGNGIGALFDFGFRHYWTPALVRAAWFIFVVMALLGIVASLLIFLPDSATASTKRPIDVDGGPAWRPPASIVSGTVRLIAFTISVLSIVQALIAARVICEYLIVIFDIAESLKTVQTHAAAVEKHTSRIP